MRKVGLFLMCAVLSACTSSHVLVGKQRPPISPDQVQVYLAPPANFEQVAMLEASSEASFAITRQGKTNKVIERLKMEAAKVGANGLLLQGIGSEAGATVMTNTGSFTGNSYSGFAVGAPVMHKAGTAIAIYVTP